MSALVNREKRARAKQNRRERRRKIIEAAAHLFSRQPYAAVTLDNVGRRIGVAKGIASVHFATKEELFLEVLRNALREWFDQIEADLGGEGEPLDRIGLASWLADDLAGRPELTRLLSLAHNVVEQNVEIMPAQLFLDELREGALSLAVTLERRCDAIGAGEGVPFLRRLAAIVVGLNQTANSSGLFAALLREEAFAPFRVEPRDELRFLIERILPGQ
jgi:AcrR family transcriptional regulator